MTTPTPGHPTDEECDAIDHALALANDAASRRMADEALRLARKYEHMVEENTDRWLAAARDRNRLERENKELRAALKERIEAFGE